MSLASLGPAEWENLLRHLSSRDCATCLCLSRGIRHTLSHDEIWKGLAQHLFRELGLKDPKTWLCRATKSTWRSAFAPTTYRAVYLLARRYQALCGYWRVLQKEAKGKEVVHYRLDDSGIIADIVWTTSLAPTGNCTEYASHLSAFPSQGVKGLRVKDVGAGQSTQLWIECKPPTSEGVEDELSEHFDVAYQDFVAKTRRQNRPNKTRPVPILERIDLPSQTSLPAPSPTKPLQGVWYRLEGNGVYLLTQRDGLPGFTGDIVLKRIHFPSYRGAKVTDTAVYIPDMDGRSASWFRPTISVPFYYYNHKRRSLSGGDSKLEVWLPETIAIHDELSTTVPAGLMHRVWPLPEAMEKSGGEE